jgi:amino acid transporter
VHAAGSLYDYVTRGLGERTGTAAGWLYYAGITVVLYFGVRVSVLVIGFASTFVTRARRSASSELSDLTKSTA